MQLLIKNLRKSYYSDNGRLNILEDINIQVKKGEFVCIIGTSGCGKSTLLNIIAGLEKHCEGSIQINNNEIKNPGPDRAVIFQESALFPWLSVIENMEIGLKFIKVPKGDRRERALKYLDMVNLKEFEKYYVHQLSGGMKQRVAIARALSLESDVLLMDEPFASVDSHTRDLLHLELIKIWEKTHKTIIFVTHSIEEAILLADRIVILGDRPARIKRIIELTKVRPRIIDNENSILIQEIKKELGV